MTKDAHDKIADGLNEALDVAKGTRKPLRLLTPEEMERRKERLKSLQKERHRRWLEKRPSPAPRIRAPSSLIEAFAHMLGFTNQSIAKAGPVLGFSDTQIYNRNRDGVELKRIEKLGMTAAMLDLPEFSEAMLDVPEANMEAAKAAAAVIRRALAAEPMA